MLRNMLKRPIGHLKLRKAPARTFLLAVIGSFIAALPLGIAVGASSDPNGAIEVEEAGQYPATPRVEVASGTLSGIGRYQLLHSRDYKGGMCVGIVLLDQVPPEARGPDISEGCGGPEYLNVGKETDADGKWTILVGKVPEKAERLKVKKKDGSPSLDVPVVDDSKGIGGKWVVHKLQGRLGDVEFQAVDDGARPLATQQFGD